MSTAHDDVIKQLREQQQKYTYYIVALCVAGIGFAVQKSMNMPLSKTQIPLAAAVCSWGMSIFCGLKFLGIMMSALYSNSALIEVWEGKHPLSGSHPEKMKIGAETILKGIEKMSQKTKKFSIWQDRFFYFGIICFVGWRIWEMYKITV